MTWRDQARCGDLAMTEPEKYDRIFFESGNPTTAQRMCEGCPVQQACYDFASTSRIPHGVFGGESGAHRRLRLGISHFEDQTGIVVSAPTPTDDPDHFDDWWWRLRDSLVGAGSAA